MIPAQWKQTQQPAQMDRDYQNHQRSPQQNSNFQQMNHVAAWEEVIVVVGGNDRRTQVEGRYS